MTKDNSEPRYNPFILRELFPDASKILAPLPPLHEMAKTCLFVLDANSLLAPFNIGTDSLTDVGEILKRLRRDKRLFVPAHALREFAKHRSAKIAGVFSLLHSRNSTIPETPRIETPMLDGLPQFVALQASLEGVKKATREYRKCLTELMDVIRQWNADDPVSLLYSDLFTPDTIAEHKREDTDILGDLANRTTHSIPPGYKDKAKECGGVGDLLIWHTILSLGKEKNADVVFVSNDEKCDWMTSQHNEALFPRYELQAEFHRETGRHISIITFSRFLKLLGAVQATINEAAAAEQEQRSQEMLGVLRQLWGIAQSYIDDYQVERDYQYITEPRFVSLVAQYSRIWTSHCESVDTRPEARRAYSSLEVILAEAVSLSGQIKYMESRMKKAADEEQARLLTLCEQFIQEYRFLAS